ncbi:MAG: recombinase RecA [Candidatus Omnitrophica bacterium]|nr:recombinase RecA [Candidatus Omnitrophota bacterium]
MVKAAQQKDKSEEKDTAKQDKTKALSLALGQIEKQFGKGSIMRLSKDVRVDVTSIPTGAVSLDIALGVGGVPRGRVVEIFGPESSGKTTLTLSIISQVQKRGGTAAFIDAENAFDPSYAEKVGVNLEELLISQPDSGEQALNIAETLVRSNAVDVIVVDSVAALVPRAEIEGEIGDTQIGLQARLMSQALRKLSSSINKSKTCVIFINQIREKIGVMFGNPETTPGGRALKFYASVRLDIRRIEYLKSSDRAIGSHVKVKVVKNKVAPPFRIAEFDIMYDEGISRESSAIDAGLVYNLVKKDGAWFSCEGEKIGQGKENARAYFKQNPKILNELEKKIKEAAKASEKA